MIKKIVFVALLLFFQELFAEDCYFSRTVATYEIEVSNHQAFLTETRKDPNGISIFSYKKQRIEGINFAEIRLISVVADRIIVANNEGYYCLSNFFQEKEKLQVNQFAESKNVSDFFQDDIFCIDGKWQQLVLDKNENKWITFPIKNFPNDPIFIGKVSDQAYLLKDEHSVYVYNKNTILVEHLPNLQPQKAQLKYQYNSSIFVCDEDTMYLFQSDGNYRNITSEFKKIDFQKNTFTRVRFIKDAFGKLGLSFSDGNIWLLKENNLKKSVSFQQIKQVEYNFGNKLFLYKANYYKTFEDLLLGKKFSINVLNVKNLQNLKYTNFGIYYDTEFFYKEDETTRKLEILPTDFEGYRYLNSSFYANQAAISQKPLWCFWATEKDVFYIDDSPQIIKEFAYKQPIKDLKLAYLIDDKLLIEDVVIRNIKTASDLQFVGSVVYTENPCDMQVTYTYYFKDKSAVYKYQSGKRELEKLTIDPKFFTEKQILESFLL